MPGHSAPQVPTAASRASRWGFALLFAAIASAIIAADPPTKPAPIGVKLPDGTYLWTGTPGTGERVDLSSEDWKKLLEKMEQLQKQVAIRKPLPPSECKLRVKVEKRGELPVAAVTAVLAFRTSEPRTAVAVGGKKAFPVAAKLDGNAMPVLEASDEGYAALIEAPGAHTLTLELETPVAARGAKGELGFELGLPRAAITTLTLDPLPANVKRVNLITRSPDMSAPGKPPTLVRETGVDAKHLTGAVGKALGAVESLEVTWDPPSTASTTVAVRTAEWDIACNLTDTSFDTTAKLRLSGTAREWQFTTPAGATVTVDRTSTATPGTGSSTTTESPPVVTKPVDANKPVWKVDFGTGSPAEWVLTATARQPRAKAPEAKHRGPFAVGPFAALDVFRQSGTVKVSAGPHARFLFKHGPSLRQVEAPAAMEDEGTVAFFRLATGLVPAQFQPTPLLEIEARSLTGKLIVRPSYRLKLTESGWRVTMDVRVTPVRSDVDQVLLELPTSWPTPESMDAAVDTIRLQPEGSRTAVVHLAAGHRDPFDFTLAATLPVDDSAHGNTTLFLPRFPQTPEAESQVRIEVPAGKEVRAAVHEWDGDQPSGWSHPLAAVLGADSKPLKPITAVAGKFDQGVASVDVTWQPHRPELIADLRADVDVQDRQTVVEGEIRLRSPDGFPKLLRFHGPTAAVPMPRQPFPFVPVLHGLGEWDISLPTPEPGKEATSAVIKFAYVLPAPPRPAGSDERVGRKVPVGLFFPMGVTRADAMIRVWPAASAGPQTITAGDGWRTLPPEPAADRGSLPALTLLGSGTDLSLALDLRPARNAVLAMGQVERSVVEAWGGDGGLPVQRRGLFAVRHWFSPTLEVELPGLLAGKSPEVLVNGKTSTGAHPSGVPNVVRVPLPADVDRGGSFTLEVKYPTTALRGMWDDTAYLPPKIRGAVYTGPTRWLIALPSGSTPLLFDESCQVEQRWRWLNLLPQPTAAYTSAELERWFRQVAEPDASATEEPPPLIAGEHLTFRQDVPGPVWVVRVPRVGIVILCSLVAFVFGLILTRMSAPTVGVLLLVLAGGLAATAALMPQPAAQAAAAALPGLLALTVVLVAQAAWRWYQRRRLTHLPSFTRTRIEPTTASAIVLSPVSSPSARNGLAPGSTGTAGHAAIEPGQASGMNR